MKDFGDNTHAVTYRVHFENRASTSDYFGMKEWPLAMEGVYNLALKSSEFGEHYIANYSNI
ncbi:hypothetical protein PI23P_02317 [Polaribacter irgensii 23-P]|uniref:Uncharacterized protein n=1 Tax=Polaribacter irgensii 23-P TaxID=313594 RepID=A4BWF0_9FLAO|nr:hypothetical protein [Polaribacter irgensii]EAR13291.1 hypothetical protein PI23P_02317 [Polaribacter irgensii 23-P]